MLDSWDPDPAAVGWAIAGLAVVALVGYALYALIGAIVLGLFLYYATRPAYRWVATRIDHPDIAAAAALMLVGVPIIAILGYATVLGARELSSVLGEAGLVGVRNALSPYVDVAELADPRAIVSRFNDRVPQLVGLLQSALLWLLRIFVAFTVAFFLLRDDQKIAAWGRQSVPGEYGVVPFLEGVDDDLTTIYTGNLITIGLTGLIAAVVYYVLSVIAPPGTGIATPILLGLVIGIATLIPAVGMKLVYIPYTGFLVWRSVTGGAPLWFPVVFFVVTLLVIDTFPDIFIRSYVSKGSINMGLIMLGYVLGATAFGWYGVFLAPVVLVVFLHFAHRVLPNLLDPSATRLVTDDWPR